MSDPSNIYHTSAVPPTMYYCGNEIIGGAVHSREKAFEGIYYDFRESLNMQFLDGGLLDTEEFSRIDNSTVFFKSLPQISKYTQTENGLYLANTNYSNAYIRIPFLGYKNGYDLVLEFETGEMGVNPNTYNNFIVHPKGADWNNDSIMSYQNIGSGTGYHAWSHSGLTKISTGASLPSAFIKDLEGNNIEDAQFFANSVIKIVMSPNDSRGTLIYKNDNLIGIIEDGYVLPAGTASNAKNYAIFSFGTTSSSNWPIHPFLLKWFKEYYEPIPVKYIIQ